MKKKFMLVLAAVAVASLFWACGSGEILNMTQDDDLVSMAYTGTGATEAIALNGMVKQAVADYCGGDENCVKVVMPGASAIPQAESSSSLGYNPINPGVPFSSSSTVGF